MIGKFLRLLHWIFCALWGLFCLWMCLWVMPLSALHGFAGLWAIWPGRSRGALGWLVLAAAPFSVVLVGLPEYAVQANHLHCRARAATGLSLPGDCTAEDIRAGQAAMSQGQAIFSTRERLSIHGFNLLLAAGGALAGFPEVARETLWLSSSAAPLDVVAQGEALRRRQCTAGATPNAALSAPIEGDGAFMMRSAVVRGVVAGLRDAAGGPLPEGQTRPLPQKRLYWYYPGAGGNNSFYSQALRSDTLRVPLALVTKDGFIDGVARGTAEGVALDLRWTASIGYPTDGAFQMAIPTVLPWVSNPIQLRVSETAFCGMQMDGAMNPYPLTYRWTVMADDPRLDAGRNTPQRGPLEAALVWAMGR